MHIFDFMRPMFVNGTCLESPGKRIFESWKTLEFGLCKSWKVLKNACLYEPCSLVLHVTMSDRRNTSIIQTGVRIYSKQHSCR